jgi:hypothetical protein
MDAPKIEGAAAPPKPEAAKAKPTPPKEKPVATKDTKPATAGGARKTLEDIASGKSVAEAVNPVVEQAPLPDREVVSQILSEANSLLLDLKDMRILIAAVATQGADTPLGNEMRIDTLRMVANMSNENMAPESVVKLAALQKKIQDLKLPEAVPANSQLVQTISQYNEAHPDKAVPTEILDQLTSGQVESPQIAAKLLQSNTDLAAEVWKGITGQEGFTGFNPTPENILALTQLEATPENVAKMQAVFGSAKQAKESFDFVGKVVPGIMLGALGIMFITQISGIEQAGAGGH